MYLKLGLFKIGSRVAPYSGERGLHLPGRKCRQQSLFATFLGALSFPFLPTLAKSGVQLYKPTNSTVAYSKAIVAGLASFSPICHNFGTHDLYGAYFHINQAPGEEGFKGVGV